MHLVEVAVRRVRGFSVEAQFNARDGYTVIRGPDERPPPLTQVLLELLIPTAARSVAGSSGTLLKTADGAQWRIERSGATDVQLSRHRGAASTFEVVSANASDIQAILRDEVGMLEASRYQALYTFESRQLPSRMGKPVSNSPAPVGATRALEDELAQAKQAAALQFEGDAIARDVFALEARLEAHAQEVQRLTAALAEADQHARMASTTVDVRGADAMAKALASESSELEAMRAASPGPPQASSLGTPLAVAALAVIALIVGALLDWPLRLAALLAVPLASVAAVLALRGVESRQQASLIRAKLMLLDVRQRGLAVKLAEARGVVATALARAEVDTVKEYEELMAGQAARGAQREELAQLLRRLTEGADIEATRATLAERKAARDAMASKLEAIGQTYVRPVADVERELKQLRASPPPTAQGEQSAIARLVSVGQSHLGDAWRGILEPANTVAQALGVAGTIQLSADNEISVQRTSGLRPVAVLPSLESDLVYLALRLAIVALSPPHVLPVVVDDGIASILPASRKAALSSLLVELAQVTQVLHAVGKSFPNPAIDV